MATTTREKMVRVRKLTKNIPKEAKEVCDGMLAQLEKAKRPSIEAIKCSLDNSLYKPRIGYLTPGSKKVRTELNVSSVQKIARMAFMLEVLLGKLEVNAVQTKRELYYIAKGEVKSNAELKPLDFNDQGESDAIIDFICDMFEIYREEFNCFADDRGGQTYSQNLIVTETLPDGSKATIDLSTLGTAPYQPKNKPQDLQLKVKRKVDFCLVVESLGTANSIVSMGITKRNKCIIIGAQGVPSNGVRGWCRTIQNQLDVPIYFFGDLDAYTVQNIYRTLKAGSAASLIRNEHFSAPDVKFLGLLPQDVEKYDLDCYQVRESDAKDARSLKKARDAMQNDPFFHDPKNKKLTAILKWLVQKKIRCEQQALFSVDPKDPQIFEKIVLDKIKKRTFI